MIRHCLTALIFSLLYLSCYAQQDSLMTDSGYWENGRLKYAHYFPYGVTDYDFTYWHPDGSKHMEGRYRNQDIHIIRSWDRQGKLVVDSGRGYHTEYYENGQKMEEGFIKYEMMDSSWKEYYPSGKKKGQGQYLSSRKNFHSIKNEMDLQYKK